MFQVYNTICNSCITKLDPVLKKCIIFKEEDGMPLQNTGRKTVMVDAATNTDDIENCAGYPNREQSNVLKNALLHEEKPFLENTSTNE